MKTKHIICFALALFATVSVFGQTQRGYVKTKGRMVDGKLVAGKGLKGAIVYIDGKREIVVNANDGSFSFPVTNQQFRLDSVKKEGYQLVDYEVCKSYTNSSGPLYIVMETPEQQLQDRLDAERKIRRNLQSQLQSQEDELERMKSNGKITIQEYQTALQNLYAEQESNERLIEDMAVRYASLDYDQLDAFYQQVSYCIENGDLVKANTLLHSRGDISKQVGDIRQHGQALHKEREALQKAEEEQHINIQEAAQRCYSYYETFAVQRLNDTAAYYLELRASLDTTNLDWMNDAGLFISEYLADPDRAFPYYQSILRNAREIYGENSDWVATCYSNIASYYYDKGDYDQSSDYNDRAFAMRVNLYGPNHPDVAVSYNNKGCTLMKQGDYDMALVNFNQALHILQRKYGENYPLVASTYSNMGEVYYYQADYGNAIEYQTKALVIRQSLLDPDHPDIALSLNNIGCTCLDIGDYETALTSLNTAYAIWSSLYGDNHPLTLRCIGNIGSAYMLKGIELSEQDDLEGTQENLSRALPLLKTAYGDDNDFVIQIQRILDKMKTVNQQKAQ